MWITLRCEDAISHSYSTPKHKTLLHFCFFIARYCLLCYGLYFEGLGSLSGPSHFLSLLQLLFLFNYVTLSLVPHSLGRSPFFSLVLFFVCFWSLPHICCEFDEQNHGIKRHKTSKPNNTPRNTKQKDTCENLNTFIDFLILKVRWKTLSCL